MPCSVWGPSKYILVMWLAAWAHEPFMPCGPLCESLRDRPYFGINCRSCCCWTASRRWSGTTTSGSTARKRGGILAWTCHKLSACQRFSAFQRALMLCV